jgi:hypothetical protein
MRPRRTPSRWKSSTAQPLGQSSAAQTISGGTSPVGVHGEATTPGRPSTGPAKTPSPSSRAGPHVKHVSYACASKPA